VRQVGWLRCRSGPGRPTKGTLQSAKSSSMLSRQCMEVVVDMGLAGWQDAYPCSRAGVVHEGEHVPPGSASCSE
jgi:hypothetical protein